MPRPRSEATIRRIDPDDATAVAELVLRALGDKYRPALGRRATAGIVALVRRDIAHIPDTCRWVAEIDGRVAGSVTLVLAHDVATDVPRALADAVGWPGAVRATIVLAILGHGRLGDDEAYIDELAVDDWARRRGVAQALLDTCATAARSAGRRRLTLWVTINNDGARRLYERAGFREVRRRRWIAGRLLFRAPGAIFMERRLESVSPAGEGP